jgi:hypothetical protein
MDWLLMRVSGMRERETLWLAYCFLPMLPNLELCTAYELLKLHRGCYRVLEDLPVVSELARESLMNLH